MHLNTCRELKSIFICFHFFYHILEQIVLNIDVKPSSVFFQSIFMGFFLNITIVDIVKSASDPLDFPMNSGHRYLVSSVVCNSTIGCNMQLYFGLGCNTTCRWLVCFIASFCDLLSTTFRCHHWHWRYICYCCVKCTVLSWHFFTVLFLYFSNCIWLQFSFKHLQSYFRDEA